MDAAEKISLSGSVGVAQVAELHASTQTIINGEQSIDFDFADVRDIDASILQLLIAARQAAAERGTQVLLTEVGDSIAKSIASHGAHTLLESAETSAEETAGEEVKA